MALRAFIAAGLLVVAGFCRAQAFSVGGPSIDQSATLYRISLANRSASVVGTAGNGSNGQPIVNMAALAFDSDRTLYGIALTGGTSPTLVTLNQVSGRASAISQINGIPSTSARALSLAFGCNRGPLWMASADTNDLWELTPGTGQTHQIGNLGVKITGMAFRNNVLYGVGGSGNANLYKIAVDSGKATLIGPYGASVPTPVDAAFDDAGALWSLVRNFNGNDLVGLNTLAQINTDTGALSTIGTIPDPLGNTSFPQTMQGLAIAPPVCSPVIEPPKTVGAPGLTAIGLGALIASLLAATLFALPGLRRD